MGKQMHKGHYGHYSGNSKFSKRHDEDYDAKEAYNKNLTASARLHYLENLRHDHDSPAHSRGDRNDHDMGPEGWKAHKQTMHGIRDHGGPNMSALPKLDSRMKYGHEDFDYDFASDAGVFDKELSDHRSVRRAQKRYRRKTK